MNVKLLTTVNLGLAVAAVAVVLTGRPPAPVPPVDVFDSRLSADLERRVVALEQAVDEMRSLLDELEAAPADEGAPAIPDAWRVWCENVEAELAELRRKLQPDSGEGETFDQRWLRDSRVAQDAQQRYRQTFLRRRLPMRTRARALTVLGAFPDEQQVLTEPVRREIESIVHDPASPAHDVPPVLQALGEAFEGDFARDMLMHAVRYGAHEPVRNVALRGLETWRQQPAVDALLQEALRSGDADERRSATIGLGRVVPRVGPKTKDR